MNMQLTIGIANTKKADLDALTDSVSDAQYTVDQLQAVVDSLQAKSTEYTGFLNTANNNKATTLTNLNLVKDAVNSIEQLASNSKTAFNQASKASVKISSNEPTDKGLSLQMSQLINDLIFSVEVIDKISALVDKQKAANPVIPDELITLMTKATTDANDAVAKSLTALNSCYAAEAGLLEVKNLTALGTAQVSALENKVKQGSVSGSGCPEQQSLVKGVGEDSTGLLGRLQYAYDHACTEYKDTLAADQMVTHQLDHATTQLSNAETNLASLKSGLAAAQAAALAA